MLPPILPYFLILTSACFVILSKHDKDNSAGSISRKRQMLITFKTNSLFSTSNYLAPIMMLVVAILLLLAVIYFGIKLKVKVTSQ